MTYNDIYIKFLIEYDKANITSSYPSLTKYEIATILDKAYLALIAQKVTGNNPRRMPFEADIKAVEDLRGLVTVDTLNLEELDLNILRYHIPEDFMFFVSAELTYSPSLRRGSGAEHITKPHDNFQMRPTPIDLINHQYADKFKLSRKNMPWLQRPVGYFSFDNYFDVMYDSYEIYDGEDFTFDQNNYSCSMIYIRKPEKFTAYYDKFTNELDNDQTIDFQLNDYMAEELINLAILMVAETVESTRLTTKTQTRPLES